jgi:hypothetical protein
MRGGIRHKVAIALGCVRSGLLARRVRELAQQVRELDLGDEIEVVFPDKDLEAAVRETLERPKGPLTKGHLKRMKELDAGPSHRFDNIKQIEDLTGLEHAVNLTKLLLRKNQISDVSALASLTNLTTLWLDMNQINDVSPLTSLTNLTFLNLSRNQLNQESIDIHIPNLRSRGVQVKL